MVSINDLLPPAKTQNTPQFIPVTRKPPQTIVSRRKEFNLARPSSAERQDQLDHTQEALEALIAARNGEVNEVPKSRTIEYKSAGDDTSRTLRIVEQQNDPLEPPRHRYRKEHKVTPVTTETSAPILRKEAKLSAEEKQEWMVPASVSNWKNPRGYIIGLDKRAAADKSPAQTSTTKQNTLASVLSAADREFQEEQQGKRQAEEQAASELEKQQKLKLKLLAQKSKSSSSQKRSHLDDVHDPNDKPDNGVDANTDLFDSRLYHKSKRRHDIYDKPLFAAQSSDKFRASSGKHRNDGELKDLTTVEFEEQ